MIFCRVIPASVLVLLGSSLPGCADDAQTPPANLITSEQADFRIELVAADLKHPWGMAFLPDGNMVITERDGDLRLFANGQLSPDPISGVPEVEVNGQGGLLDVALDPDFAANGWLYLSYAGVDDGGRSSTHVARGRLAGGALEDVEVIFRSNSSSSSSVHWGSRLAFDGEGRLFVTVGERGNEDNSQDLSAHGGSIVRINPDGSVPADNPFIDQDGALPEIYAYGVRNPQGFAVHPETGALWEQEHGPQGGDEINIIEAGANYGWPVITWGVNYGGDPINDGLREQDGMAQPVHYWDPSIAPSGMVFYEGDAFPEWQGDLLVGALKYALIARLEVEGEEVVGEERLIEGDIGRIRDVEVGPDGLVYVLTDFAHGGLYRLVPAT